MPQHLQTETDRLANVIQVLQLGQKTGKLIAERYKDSIFEQGLITFVKGQITHVSINQQQGPGALNNLMNWGYCRFTFLFEYKTDVPGVLPSPPASEQPSSGRLPAISLPTASSERSSTKATPTVWLIAPYPTRHKEEGIRLIDQLGLSRTHRHLFLLIDGKRTTKELSRLMTREPGDVLKLLRELEWAGVIQL